MVGLELRIGLLGPLSVRRDDAEIQVPAARQRALLAVLAARAGQVVSFDDLAELIWDGSPPRGARATTRGYVKRVRQLLGPGLSGRLVTREPGYRLDVTAEELDLLVFGRLCAEGSAAARAGAWPPAARLLGEALTLWRGQPLTDIPSEYLRSWLLPQLETQRLQAIEWRVEAILALGRPGELVAELTDLTTAHPMRERFWAQLMLALYRCGRQGEALSAYQRAAKNLIEELGIDPGPELGLLHKRILAAEPGLLVPSPSPWPGTGVTGWAAERNGPGAVVPRQLPAPVPYYVGRADQLAELDALAASAPTDPGALVIGVIHGGAGVGKTTLAVHWAHRASTRFPDGQLYVNLRGFDLSEKLVDPAEAVRGFLDAFHYPTEQLPGSAEAQAALYRSLVAGRRMLIVLDNARDAGHVRPLLPGSPSCLVLVTSRNRLTGLVAAEGARPIALDVLNTEEAGELLSRRIGSQRVSLDPAAASDLAVLCAQLPLALTIAAARTITRPNRSLAALVSELRDARRRLDQLETGDAAISVRAVFSWSYRNLADPAARMFRLLGLHLGPDISVPAAASLAGVGAEYAAQLLAELADAHLATEDAAGRFSLHDLLRAYAAEHSHTGSETNRQEAVHRILDHYLHSAYAAVRVLSPWRSPISLDPAVPGVAAEHPADQDKALAWFDAEHRVLLAATAAAEEEGYDGHAWQLPWTLAVFLDRRGHWNDYTATQHTALEAARRLGNRDGQAQAHQYLGHAYVALGRHDLAHSHLSQALAWYGELDDQPGEARMHLDISTVLARQGRYREAITHDQEGLRLFRAAGQEHGVARALNSFGWDLAHLDDHGPQAIGHCQEALRLLRGLGDRYGQSAASHSLGYANYRAGYYDDAAACYQDTLDLLDVSHDSYHVAETLTSLGDCHRAAGRTTAAREAWERALAILDEMQHPDAESLRGKLGQLAPPFPDDFAG